ncbi:MAG: hypothetical protein ABIV06_08475 [Thermoanaerobaculia bacterium]
MTHRTVRIFMGLALAAALMSPVAAQTATTGKGYGGGHHGGSGGRHGGHGGQGGGHYRGHYGGYYGGYIGLGGYGWYGYPGYGYYGGSGGYGGYGYYGSPGWGYTSVYPAAGASHGALDLDVSPESAQVYVNGNLAGVADDFDGFPDFLWLEKGTYDVVIFAPGFETISRQYSVYGGLVIDVNDSMVHGQETLPQDLVSKQTVNREERLRRDRENEDEVRAYGEAQGRRHDSPATDEAQGNYERRAPDRLDARGEPGSLRLEVEPDDASVYLDGRFLGTGRELGKLRSGLIVDPGEHHIEVVRPGRGSQEKSFSVSAGEEVRLDIELDED